jgi:hypothetical protein
MMTKEQAINSLVAVINDCSIDLTLQDINTLTEILEYIYNTQGGSTCR